MIWPITVVTSVLGWFRTGTFEMLQRSSDCPFHSRVDSSKIRLRVKLRSHETAFRPRFIHVSNDIFLRMTRELSEPLILISSLITFLRYQRSYSRPLLLPVLPRFLSFSLIPARHTHTTSILAAMIFSSMNSSTCLSHEIEWVKKWQSKIRQNVNTTTM